MNPIKKQVWIIPCMETESYKCYPQFKHHIFYDISNTLRMNSGIIYEISNDTWEEVYEYSKN